MAIGPCEVGEDNQAGTELLPDVPRQFLCDIQLVEDDGVRVRGLQTGEDLFIVVKTSRPKAAVDNLVADSLIALGEELDVRVRRQFAGEGDGLLDMAQAKMRTAIGDKSRNCSASIGESEFRSLADSPRRATNVDTPGFAVLVHKTSCAYNTSFADLYWHDGAASPDIDVISNFQSTPYNLTFASLIPSTIFRPGPCE